MDVECEVGRSPWEVVPFSVLRRSTYVATNLPPIFLFTQYCFPFVLLLSRASCSYFAFLNTLCNWNTLDSPRLASKIFPCGHPPLSNCAPDHAKRSRNKLDGFSASSRQLCLQLFTKVSSRSAVHESLTADDALNYISSGWPSIIFLSDAAISREDNRDLLESATYWTRQGCTLLSMGFFAPAIDHDELNTIFKEHLNLKWRVVEYSSHDIRFHNTACCQLRAKSSSDRQEIHRGHHMQTVILDGLRVLSGGDISNPQPWSFSLVAGNRRYGGREHAPVSNSRPGVPGNGGLPHPRAC
jgi:hypothetical protein